MEAAENPAFGEGPWNWLSRDDAVNLGFALRLLNEGYKFGAVVRLPQPTATTEEGPWYQDPADAEAAQATIAVYDELRERYGGWEVELVHAPPHVAAEGGLAYAPDTYVIMFKPPRNQPVPGFTPGPADSPR